MKNLLVLLLLFVFTSCTQKESVFTGEKIVFPSDDGIMITADLYLLENKKAPLILLFHQAGFSRGEYRSIAPKLNQLGFSCMAIDQRSGKEVNNVINETYQNAQKVNKNVAYIDALPDMRAAVRYASTELENKKLILWGSSYSASLVLYLATQHEVEGVLSFSPGEYFMVDGKTIKNHASKIQCPVFITSSKNETDKWKEIYDSILSPKTSFIPNTKGYHGSKALWPDSEGNQEYWDKVEKFLSLLKK